MINAKQRKSKLIERHMNADAKGLDPDYYEAYKTVYDKVGGNALEKFDDNKIVSILGLEHKGIKTPQQAKEYVLSLSQEEFDKLIDKFGVDSDVIKKAKSDRKKARRKKNRASR